MKLSANMWISDMPVNATHTTPDVSTAPVPDDMGADADADLMDRDTNSADADFADPDSVDADPVDATDADVWEALDQGLNVAVDPDQRHTSGAPSSVPSSFEVSQHPTASPDPPVDDGDTNSQTELTIDSFPHGHAGSPIAGTLRGRSEYQLREALGTSPWAPFHSKCDWDIALWAKMRGPSSTAFTELLQIPEV